MGGTQKFAIPIAEMAAAYASGNPQLGLNGAEQFYEATKSGKEDKTGFATQLKSALPSAINAGMSSAGGAPGGGDSGFSSFFGGGNSGMGSVASSVGSLFGGGGDGGTSGIGPVADGNSYGSMLDPSSGGSGSSGGMGSMFGNFSAGDALKSGAAIYGGIQQLGDKAHAKEVAAQNESRLEDTANRREATYRQDREMLLDAIGTYSTRQGWKQPDPKDALPGAGTSRQLPFENPLYTGESHLEYPTPQMANLQPGQASYPGGPSVPQVIPGQGAVPAAPTAADSLPTQTSAPTTADSGSIDNPVSQAPNTNGTPNQVAPSTVTNAQQAAAQSLSTSPNPLLNPSPGQALQWRYL